MRHCSECGCAVERTFFMDEGKIFCVECAWDSDDEDSDDDDWEDDEEDDEE